MSPMKFNEIFPSQEGPRRPRRKTSKKKTPLDTNAQSKVMTANDSQNLKPLNMSPKTITKKITLKKFDPKKSQSNSAPRSPSATKRKPKWRDNASDSTSSTARTQKHRDAIKSKGEKSINLRLDKSSLMEIEKALGKDIWHRSNAEKRRIFFNRAIRIACKSKLRPKK